MSNSPEGMVFFGTPLDEEFSALVNDYDESHTYPDDVDHWLEANHPDVKMLLQGHYDNGSWSLAYHPAWGERAGRDGSLSAEWGETKSIYPLPEPQQSWRDAVAAAFTGLGELIGLDKTDHIPAPTAEWLLTSFYG